MTREQANHYKRDVSVQGLVGENPGQFPSEEEYTKDKKILDAEITVLENMLIKQCDLERTSSAPKKAAREAAVVPMFSLASIIYSMAFAKGNISLMEKVKITFTELQRLSDTRLLIRFDNLLSSAAEYLPILLKYGLTQEIINSDTALVNTYNEEVRKFARHRVDLTELTKQIKKQFKIVDQCIVPFDNLVENKRFSDPVWYSRYLTARKVDRSPSSHLSAIGKVYDSATGQALTGAVVKVYCATDGKTLTSGADLVKTIKVKWDGGGFKIKSLSTGTYIVKATYAGYTDQVITIYINEGNLTRFDLALRKLA